MRRRGGGRSPPHPSGGLNVPSKGALIKKTGSAGKDVAVAGPSGYRRSEIVTVRDKANNKSKETSNEHENRLKAIENSVTELCQQMNLILPQNQQLKQTDNQNKDADETTTVDRLNRIENVIEQQKIIIKRVETNSKRTFPSN